MVMRLHPLRLALVLLVLLLFPAAAAGCSTQAAYPAKAIDVVVPYAPGGGTDVAGRLMARYLSAELGVPVNVVNKGGGNQIPGVMSVLSAAPDGYTLLVDSQGSSSLYSIVKEVPFKIQDRSYGPMMMAGPQAFAVNGKSPWNSLKDVAAAAKNNPGSFTWGRLGGTSVTDFSLLQFFDGAGIDVSKTKPVSFDGAGPAVTAVAGGHIQFAAGGVPAMLPLRSTGDLKVLAVTGDKRLSSLLPDVPSASESGFPTVDMKPWFAFSGPANLPKNALDRLSAAAKKITEDPKFAKDIEGEGRYAIYLSPDQTREQVSKEAQLFNTMFSKFSASK